MNDKVLKKGQGTISPPIISSLIISKRKKKNKKNKEPINGGEKVPPELRSIRNLLMKYAKPRHVTRNGYVYFEIRMSVAHPYKYRGVLGARIETGRARKQLIWTGKKATDLLDILHLMCNCEPVTYQLTKLVDRGSNFPKRVEVGHP